MSQTCILLLLSLVTILPAQAAAKASATRESELDQRIAHMLLAFARKAAAARMPSHALIAYEEVLDHYDSSSKTALQGLGWRQVNGTWQPPAQPPPRVDAATPRQQQDLARQEQQLHRHCAALHRELGKALLAEGDRARGIFQLERALAHDPTDVEAHLGLGHVEEHGFYGTEAELSFVRRFRAIAAKAAELSHTTFPCTTLAETSMPPELRSAGVPMTGARGEHCSIWVAAEQDITDGALQMAERCHALLEFLGAADATVKVVSSYDWLGIASKPAFLAFGAANADKLTNVTVSQLPLLGGTSIRVGSRYAQMDAVTPDRVEDDVVAFMAHRSLGDRLNCACGEGLSHAMTWLLCGSVKTSYMKLASTVSSDDAQGDSNSPTAWLERQRVAIRADTDLPLADVLRTPADNFRAEAHHKAWLFMLWLPARYPECWGALTTALADVSDPAQIQAAFTKTLGRSAAEVDDEWRRWAGGEQPIGKATGIGR